MNTQKACQRYSEVLCAAAGAHLTRREFSAAGGRATGILALEGHMREESGVLSRWYWHDECRAWCQTWHSEGAPPCAGEPSARSLRESEV